MARRKDGTALRLEFQLFDDDEGQGKAVYDAIIAAQEKGISKAEFVRRALMFYVSQGVAQASATELDQAVVGEAILDKLIELERKLERQTTELPPPMQQRSAVTSENDDEAASLSSGLDMSRPRRSKSTTAASRLPVKPEQQPQMDAEAARQKLLASIKSFGQEVKRGH